MNSVSKYDLKNNKPLIAGKQNVFSNLFKPFSL